MADIFKMLEAEHRRIEAVVEQITAGPASADQAGRRLLLDRLVAAESRHEAAEELAFWPAVRHRLRSGKDLADEGRRQEGDGRYVLDALRFTPGGPALDSHLAEAAALLRRHIAFEEQEVWPALRRAVGPLGARLLGARYRAALLAAPTRPHPHGPEGAAGLATVGAGAAVADRVRDRLSGRSRRLSGPLDPAAAESDGGDAVELLTADHRRVEELLRRIETEDWPPVEVTDRLVRELSVHDALEREYLYPVARGRLESGNDLYDHSLAEHGQIAAVLSEIDRRPHGDRHRRDEARRLVSLVRTHVAEEEGSLFPALRAHLSVQELAEMADRLRAARAKAPTRPHPHGAGAGVGARMSRLVVGPLDRVRDTLARRG